MKTDTSQQSRPAKAVIYARVSSTAQVLRGQGLGSQETRCREFAQMKGYEVDRVFVDEAVSGGITTRPGMQSMLAHLRDHSGKQVFIVIIDDISRLARDIKAHLELREAISSVGARLESPAIEFGEDSDSILVENLLASVSQHQRQKNAEQTKNRMRARALNGYWVFCAPRGYKYAPQPRQGKVLVRDEPIASIVQEALEGFASRRFGSQVDVKRFLERQPDFPKDLSNGEMRNQRVTDLLMQPLYAGYLELPRWDVGFRKAQHEGLISLATFERIQERLRDRAKTPARKDIKSEFPLRGFVVCADCGHPLTACWSKSKTGDKHPYYLCHHNGCVSYRKSIRRGVLEESIDRAISEVKPSSETLNRFRAYLNDCQVAQCSESDATSTELKVSIAEIERQIDSLLDRIVNAGDNRMVVTAYEKRLERLEREKLLALEKLDRLKKPSRRVDSFEPALRFLESPEKLWHSDDLACKQTAMKLLFEERPAYHRNMGLRTPVYSYPIKALAEISAGKCEMARPERFELPTP